VSINWSPDHGACNAEREAEWLFDDATRPWHLHVFPGTARLGQGGDVSTWTAR
jgi:hypothetical protein